MPAAHSVCEPPVVSGPPPPGISGGVTALSAGGADTAVRLAVPRDDFRYLQALEDAVAYRTARVSGPCGDCDRAGGGRCEDHGRDVDLISEYQVAARACGYRIEAGTNAQAARPDLGRPGTGR
jgi:hypothetical protein